MTGTVRHGHRHLLGEYPLQTIVHDHAQSIQETIVFIIVERLFRFPCGQRQASLRLLLVVVVVSIIADGSVLVRN